MISKVMVGCLAIIVLVWAAIWAILSPAPDSKARHYLGNGHLEADNNAAERAVKPVALGRKNWILLAQKAAAKRWRSPSLPLKPPSSTPLTRKPD